MTHKVFVYGTLMSGFGNNRLIDPSRTLEYGGDFLMWPGKMKDLMGFPGLIEEPDTITRITGEVFKVTDDVFKRLDHLEGYPSFYNRRVVTTGNGHSVWVYFLRDPLHYHNNAYVESGDWREHIQERRSA